MQRCLSHDLAPSVTLNNTKGWEKALVIVLCYFRIRIIQRNFLAGVAFGLFYTTGPPNARKTFELLWGREGDTVCKPLGPPSKYSIVQMWNTYSMKGAKNLSISGHSCNITFCSTPSASFHIWDSRKGERKNLHIFVALHKKKKCYLVIIVYFSNEWQWTSMWLLLGFFHDTTVVSQYCRSIVSTPCSEEFERTCS